MTETIMEMSSQRPRFTISELPLVREQRSTIDNLLLRFKKQGGYDTLRKQVWSAYANQDTKDALSEAIREVADIEIDKNPSLLARDRSKAATLMQGAVDRSTVYSDIEAQIDAEIAKHLNVVLESVRDIRTEDIGSTKATEEAQKGSKTDDQYAAETQERGAARDARRTRLEQIAKEKSALLAKMRALEEKNARAVASAKAEAEKKRSRLAATQASQQAMLQSSSEAS